MSAARPQAALATEETADRRRLRAAVTAAVTAHLLLFTLPAPSPDASAAAPEPSRPVTVLRTPRFRPPVEPPSAPADRREARMSVPGPEPEEPEILRSVELPPVEPAAWGGELLYEVPAGPPSPPAEPEVWLVGGAIARPRPLAQPRPLYPEIARRARREGAVILSVILAEDGRVRDLEVVSGLPFGLSEAAAEAVARWRYEPARLAGRAVPVRMTVTVNFRLQ
jgi:protein TonB